MSKLISLTSRNENLSKIDLRSKKLFESRLTKKNSYNKEFIHNTSNLSRQGTIYIHKSNNSYNLNNLNFSTLHKSKKLNNNPYSKRTIKGIKIATDNTLSKKNSQEKNSDRYLYVKKNSFIKNHWKNSSIFAVKINLCDNSNLYEKKKITKGISLMNLSKEYSLNEDKSITNKCLSIRSKMFNKISTDFDNNTIDSHSIKNKKNSLIPKKSFSRNKNLEKRLKVLFRNYNQLKKTKTISNSVIFKNNPSLGKNKIITINLANNNNSDYNIINNRNNKKYKTINNKRNNSNSIDKDNNDNSTKHSYYHFQNKFIIRKNNVIQKKKNIVNNFIINNDIENKNNFNDSNSLLQRKITEKNIKKKPKQIKKKDSYENHQNTEYKNNDKDKDKSVKNTLNTKNKSEADEESGMLSMDEVEDIICYNDMKSVNKNANFLFNINDYKRFMEKNRRKIEKIFFKNEYKTKLNCRNYYFGSGSRKGEQISTPSTNFSMSSKKKILK